MTMTPGVAQAFLSLAAQGWHYAVTSAPVSIPTLQAIPGSTGSATPTTTGGTTPATGPELPALLFTALLWGAFILAMIVLFMPDRTDDQRGRIRLMGVAGTGMALFFSFWAVQTQANQAEFTTGGRPNGELSENHAWIVSHTISSGYHLDADGVALGLLLLSAVVFFCAAIAGFRNDRRVRLFTVCLLLLETGVNGVLVANDWLLFLMFWALPVLPLYLLARGWGGPAAGRVAMRAAVTGLLSAALVTAAALLVTFQGGGHSFDMSRAPLTLSVPVANAAFWLFTAGFLLAAAVVPFHLPLLELEGEGTAAVSAVVVSVLPMLGAFGFMRVVVPMLPTQLHTYSLVLALIGVVTAVWGAAAALTGDRLRRMVGYLGLAQMGAIIVAISVSNSLALVGATLMLISRGLVVALLMLLAGGIEDRTRHVDLSQIGGLAWQAPRLAGAWILAGLTAAGAPLLSGFAAALLLFTGAFVGHRISTVIVIAAVLLTSVAIMRVAQRMFFGTARETFSRVRDLTTLEMTYLGILVTLIVIFGVFPNRFLGLISNGASALLAGRR